MAKIILFSGILIGEKMAGPAIRYWEFAKELSKEHEVILLVSKESKINTHTQAFKIDYVANENAHYFEGADVVISLVMTPWWAYVAKINGVRIILDVYGVDIFEIMELHFRDSLSERNKINQAHVKSFNFQFSISDGIICANSAQRDLWIGSLLSLGKITPEIYDQDKTFKNFVQLVPFGLSKNPPEKKGIGPRQLYQLNASDRLLVWGGGIWNWFDPLTLIKSIHLISLIRDDVKLVFMGAKAPGIMDEHLSMYKAAIELAKTLGIHEKHVFFNSEWIPYEERTSFLLEADIGVSTHLEQLETYYSCRTRILDYLWACLPIVATEGDSFADLIRKKGLGITVPANDLQALANAILHILDHPDVSSKMKENLAVERENFYWDRIVEPIKQIAAQRVKKMPKWKAAAIILRAYFKENGIYYTCKKILIGICKALYFNFIKLFYLSQMKKRFRLLKNSK